MLLRLSLVICTLVFSQLLFAQAVGPVVDSYAQKAAACANNQESVDKASNFEVNLARHIGSLGFLMEKESKTKINKPVSKKDRRSVQ